MWFTTGAEEKSIVVNFSLTGLGLIWYKACGRFWVSDMDQSIEDALDAMKDDPDAIRVIMERDGLSEEAATQVWHHIIETVKELKKRFESEEPPD